MPLIHLILEIEQGITGRARGCQSGGSHVCGTALLQAVRWHAVAVVCSAWFEGWPTASDFIKTLISLLWGESSTICRPGIWTRSSPPAWSDSQMNMEEGPWQSPMDPEREEKASQQVCGPGEFPGSQCLDRQSRLKLMPDINQPGKGIQVSPCPWDPPPCPSSSPLAIPPAPNLL